MSKYLPLLIIPLWFSQLSAGWHSRKAEGWAWYEDRKIAKKEEKEEYKSSSEMVQEKRRELEEKLANAMLNPTDENVLAYMHEQKKWIDKSAYFASIWSHLLLSHPELDQTVTERPISQYGLQFHKAQKLEERKQLIVSLAKDHGLLFFYEGKNPASLPVGEVVQEFSQKYGWEALNISVDGEILNLPNGKSDNGITTQMGIKVFPALVVVDPKKNTVTPVAFGLFSMNKIEENLVFQFQGVNE